MLCRSWQTGAWWISAYKQRQRCAVFEQPSCRKVVRCRVDLWSGVVQGVVQRVHIQLDEAVANGKRVS